MPKKNTREDFFEQFAVVEDGCHVWLGYVCEQGYGRFQWNGYQEYAHRLAWFFAHGKMPTKGLSVCHTCDYRLCINPDHLFLGTDADNNRDMRQKGRDVKPHILSKLQRVIIRKILKRGFSQRYVAAMFNTTQTTISEIKRGLHEPIK